MLFGAWNLAFFHQWMARSEGEYLMLAALNSGSWILGTIIRQNHLSCNLAQRTKFYYFGIGFHESDHEKRLWTKQSGYPMVSRHRALRGNFHSVLFPDIRFQARYSPLGQVPSCRRLWPVGRTVFPGRPAHLASRAFRRLAPDYQHRLHRSLRGQR